MGTVVAIESGGNVAIAGDTRAVADGTVTGQQVERVVDLGSVGAGLAGETGAIQEFRRQFEAELRGIRIERDDGLGIDEIARIAARHASDAGIDAVIAARDSDGVPRLREVGADGQVLEESTAALGSGAELAYGQLESAGAELDGDEVTSTARSILETVIQRDADSGGDVDVWALGTEEAQST